MRNMSAVSVVAVANIMTVRSDVMSSVFMNWSNMLARLVSRTISG